jgi:hypothetical protein
MKNLIAKIGILAMTMGMIIVVPQSTVWGAPIRVAIIDSGATGYVDEAISFTSLAANDDPLDHGTVVARLIREQSPLAHITMLQVCDNIDGHFGPSPEAIVRAIQWVIDNNIDVVNMSIVTKYNSAIEDLVNEAAIRYGIKFVAAGGNKSFFSGFASDENGNIVRNAAPRKPSFPSSNQHVISVGAVNTQGEIASYFSQDCDVYADGEAFGQQGTSFASARISAQIINSLAVFPNATLQQLIQLLQQQRIASLK